MRRSALEALPRRRSDLMQAFVRAMARAAAARRQDQIQPVRGTTAFQECNTDSDFRMDGMEEGDGGVGHSHSGLG